MLDKNKSLQTAEDALGLLDVASLNATLRRDMKSAVRRTCEMAGCTPRSLRLEAPVLKGDAAEDLPRRAWRELENMGKRAEHVWSGGLQAPLASCSANHLSFIGSVSSNAR